MNDMAQTIIPKSDQLNADDLIAGPLTVKITGVKIASGEQPISIHFEGDNGKPYKACKSMCRVMVTAWGADSKKYAGRSMTLYRDPTVKWAGMEVGGIRISHMSDIESKITLALTVTRANKKPFTVLPIAARANDSAGTASHKGQALPPDAMSGAGGTSADEALLMLARDNAEAGMPQYEKWWASISSGQRKAIGPERHSELKRIAESA